MWLFLANWIGAIKFNSSWLLHFIGILLTRSWKTGLDDQKVVLVQWRSASRLIYSDLEWSEIRVHHSLIHRPSLILILFSSSSQVYRTNCTEDHPWTTRPLQRTTETPLATKPWSDKKVILWPFIFWPFSNFSFSDVFSNSFDRGLFVKTYEYDIE